MTAPAARIADTTSHGTPLTPGPGSSNVFVGNMPAWRALPAGVGAGLESASNAMSSLMSSPSLTPVDASATLAQAQGGFTQSAAAAAAEGNAAAAATTASSFATLIATNVTLTATYVAAAAVPGGAAAAATAYTEGIQAAAAAAASAAMSAIAGMTDMHNCPIPCPTPPHGPGVVTQGSSGVFINNLPATRQGDNVFEACGGADAIALGSPNVYIGDAGGSSSGGAGTQAAGAAGAASYVDTSALDEALAMAEWVVAAATISYQNTAAAQSGSAVCEICEQTPST